jgi:hypothetical protein
MSSLQVVLRHEPPKYTSRTQLLWVLGGELKGKDRSGRDDIAHSTMHMTTLDEYSSSLYFCVTDIHIKHLENYFY